MHLGVNDSHVVGTVVVFPFGISYCMYVYTAAGVVREVYEEEIVVDVVD